MCRRIFRKQLAEKPPAKEKPGEFASDLAIADLGGASIMEEDPSVRQLLAEQMKPAKDPDEIPPPKPGGELLALAAPAPAPAKPPVRQGPIVPEENSMKVRYTSAAKPPVRQGPIVPDFRGKSMRDVVEESSARGIEVMIEGSGVARAQLPLPGSPLRRGEQIRIVFTR